MVLYSVSGKHKFRNAIIDQIEKTAFTADFLTVANTPQTEGNGDW